jgi:L-iditol 2-dehydrogenase
MCTEYKQYLKGGQYINIGHEAAGEVVEAPGSSHVKKGDRVIVMPQYPCGKCELCLSGEYIHCQHIQTPLEFADITHGTGTFAEFILKPDWLLIPIPDDLSYDEASMACCGLGPAFNAAYTMDINADDTVLVTGLGPVGLGTVIICSLRGARVIGLSSNEYRRELAMKLGAMQVIDPSEPELKNVLMELSGHTGFDKVIECSGNDIYQQVAMKSARRKGQVAFIGESGDFSFNMSKDLLRQGLTLHGIWHWNLKRTTEMIELIRAAKAKLHLMITHEFPMDKVTEAFELQISGQCGKVILRP